MTRVDSAVRTAGDELRLPPLDYLQRYAYVLCEAETPAECADRLDAAAARVRLVWSPRPDRSPAYRRHPRHGPSEA
ncbi:hypothetical protein [Streptomyces sp. DSM 118878]